MRVVLLTSFGSFNDMYSLCHVVCDQARALYQMGVTVEIWVMEGCKVEGSASMLAGIEHLVVPCMPQVYGTPDVVDDTGCALIIDGLRRHLNRFKPTHVIAHDLIFQSGFLTWAAVFHNKHSAIPEDTAKWYHYIHSVVIPTPASETVWYRRNLPPGQFIIYPSKALKETIVEYYHCNVAQVYACDNPRDIRNSMTEEADRIITTFQLLHRDVVMTIPFCTTRFHPKGMNHTITLFEHLKAQKLSVALVCVNASANGHKEQEFLNDIRKGTSLTTDELIFTSQLDPAWQQNFPNLAVNDLMRISNLFAYFSKGEVCSLALAEAAQAGCICMLNGKVPSLVAHAPPGTLFQDFDTLTTISQYNSQITEEDGTIHKYEGVKAYHILMEQLAQLVWDKIANSDYHTLTKNARIRYSREAHAEDLLQILAS